MVFNSTSCYYRTSENQNPLVPKKGRKKKEEKQIGDIWRQPETSVTQLMNYRLMIISACASILQFQTTSTLRQVNIQWYSKDSSITRTKI